MSRTIQQWLDEVVNPDPVLGPIYRGEKTELGNIYTHYFWRNPKRPIIKENDVFKAPADGVLVSNGVYDITAFRTDPDVGFSKTHNRERNKKLESKLNAMGYKGFIKLVGYWDETPNDAESIPIAEESYVVS